MEDQVPSSDPTIKLRDISEKIFDLQGRIHAAGDDVQARQVLEVELANQQVALENLLSISSAGFDPRASVEELTARIREGALIPRQGSVGRLLQDPDQ